MKRFSVTEMSRQPGQIMQDAKEDGAIITSHGKPTAVLLDYETFVTMRLRDHILGNPAIMNDVKRALEEPTTPWDEVKKELNLGNE